MWRPRLWSLSPADRTILRGDPDFGRLVQQIELFQLLSMEEKMHQPADSNSRETPLNLSATLIHTTKFQRRLILNMKQELAFNKHIEGVV